MAVNRVKFVQSATALALLTCALAPLFEILCHSYGSVFASGHDMNTTLALVFLIAELGFVTAKLLASVALPSLGGMLGIIRRDTTARTHSIYMAVQPTISPPYSLRI